MKSFSVQTITRDAAHALVEATRSASRDLGIEVVIAVVDAGGHLKALDRSDSSPFLAIDVAIDKAWTAASFGIGTHQWNAVLKNDQVSQLAHRPRLVSVGGGCTIVLDGKVIGAIGVSGGNAAQDQQAAETALRALGFEVAAA